MKQVILNHFGFARLPFGKDIAIDQVFRTQALTQATAMIELGLESEDLIVLTGPIGCGKSLTVRQAAAGIDTHRYHVIYLRGNLTGASELFKQVLQGLSVEPPHSILKAKPLYFATVSDATRKPVVVIDDAQDAAPQALLALKAMTNFDSDSGQRITFLLVGHPELESILRMAHFNSLWDRVRLIHQLAPMSLEETCAYIDHNLAIVKREEQLFSDAAKMETFKRTNGIPRHINTLCYQSIVRAAIDEKQIIDSQDLPDTTF